MRSNYFQWHAMTRQITQSMQENRSLMMSEKEKWERIQREDDYRTFEGSLCGVHLSHVTVQMIRPGEDRQRELKQQTQYLSGDLVHFFDSHHLHANERRVDTDLRLSVASSLL